MSNSYIKTASGVSLVVNGVPYAIAQTHANYTKIIDAIKGQKWHLIPDLANERKAVQVFVAKAQTTNAGKIQLDGIRGVITYEGVPMHGALVDQILQMMREGFTVDPLVKFMGNLMQNPSKTAIDELYLWIQANGITIDADGYMIAYKRVNDGMRSFYDNKTQHTVGQWLEMPRRAVDDRRDVTCSNGLHFCSYNYLPHYHGSQGKVLLLRIDPKDVVSIPSDYKNAKGRAARYQVWKVLDEATGKAAETAPVLKQSVITEKTNVNAQAEYKKGYQDGYAAGRSHKGKDPQSTHGSYNKAYDIGYKDGRGKKAKLY